jgi:hypothetical protein
MLDAILCPEWQYRYFSFNANWAPGMEMASMRDGCGDDWFLLFDSVGAALKGFAHELAVDQSFGANIRAQVPGEFSAFLDEPAFSMQNATFCFWRKCKARCLKMDRAICYPSWSLGHPLTQRGPKVILRFP